MFSFESKRAVEIFPDNGQSGSGYQIADNLILTAAHIFIKNGQVTSNCTIRCHIDSKNYKDNIEKESKAKLKAELLWHLKDNNIDIALIKVTDSNYIPENLVAISFACAKKEKQEEPSDFKMYAFPCYKKYTSENELKQGGTRIIGKILWADNEDTSSLNNDHLILKPEVTLGKIPETCKKSPWEGASGAPIFHNDKIIGILIKQINSDINAVKLSYVFGDKSWKEILGQFGIKNYGENQLYLSKEKALSNLSDKLIEIFRKVKAKDVLSGFSVLKELNNATNAEVVVKHIVETLKKHDGDYAIKKILLPVLKGLDSMNLADTTKFVNNTFKELLNTLLPYSFEKYLETAIAKDSEMFSIYRFSVNTKVGVEVFTVRIHEGIAEIENSQVISVRGVVDLDTDDYKKAKEFEINQVLISIWNTIFPKYTDNTRTSLSLKEKRLLVNELELLKENKGRIFYAVKLLIAKNIDRDAERFKQLANTLYQEFDVEGCRDFVKLFAMVLYGTNEDSKLIELETKLEGTITFFLDELEEKFPA